MPLTLAVRSGGAAPVPPLRLDGRGAVIGRSPDADCSLPDPTSQISSRHCQIAHRDGVYMLVDTSTNGTFVNGRRLEGPHRLVGGETIGIGAYQIGVALEAGVPGGPAPGPVRTAQSMRAASPTAVSPASAPPPPGTGGLAALLHGAGIDRSQVRADDTTALVAAGALLRRLVTALRAMEEDRAKARREIGAPPAPLAATNAIAAARSPEQALAAMLSPPHPGVMPALQAVDEAAAAIEAHRVAVLKAMQAALGGTLDRVSPAAIRSGAGGGDAALWRAYEAAFAADGGFVERFAAAFQLAYEADAKAR
ncbi:type VI secretion system-associated FHA domain protein [Sphingomonas profundi]|uniref:type VI secretion system-associated FHA domain protein n=1 Tax=Alterirhizorhabdus profundi TaxID=2681549 RepID=UPI0012E82DE2|nr:type VI secretion system-associated FHA domain protein [Sphingomonas profundi]